LGLVFGIGPGRAAPPAPPADADGDGVADADDKCPKEPARTPDGCPVIDTDGDGVPDAKDACPTEAGSAPCRCPIRDADGDKVIDELDKCPNVAGPIEGCPDPDPDRDGISGDADKCPNEPETKNGFEDADGCPDTLPDKIKKFSGVVKGIEFDNGKDTIRPVSGPARRSGERAQGIPGAQDRISGHTDTVGIATRACRCRRNARRRQSHIAEGVDASACKREVGPSIADNKTAVGRENASSSKSWVKR
jgi:hypothetical protein